MVTDLTRVLKQVANKRYVWFCIEPMTDLESTEVTIGCVKDDGVEDQATFAFDAGLLLRITDDDLKQYLIQQIDRFTAGFPIQKILSSAKR